MFLHSPEARKKISDAIKEKNKDPEFRRLSSERQKNGASRLTVNYWVKKKGYTEAESKAKISEIQKVNAARRTEKGVPKERNSLCVEYWVAKGKTVEEGVEIIRQRQAHASSFSSRFTGHVRTDESKRKISTTAASRRVRDEKYGTWVSKAEIEFFTFIKDNIDPCVESNKVVDYYIVDVSKGHKIIEFFGDYWHCNPMKCKAEEPAMFERKSKTVGDIWRRDQKRISHLQSLGYNVMIVWEHDWKFNREKCVDQIKQFLL
jgi:hypothetical protein